MKYLLFVFAFVCGVATLHGTAHATTCSVPNTFTNGTSADANAVNANFASLVGCGNAIDNTNIGVAGIFASQIIPTSIAQATFASAFGYTFSNGLTVNGTAGLTVSGPITSTVAYPANTIFFNNVSGQTAFGANASNSIQGVNCGLLQIVLIGIAQKVCADTSGNFSAAGLASFGGTVQGIENGQTTRTFLPPVYTSAGAAVANTLHGAIGSCSLTGSSSCTVNWSGAATFSSGSSYACAASIQGTVSAGTTVVVANMTATTALVQASSALSNIANVVCIGT